MQVAELYASLLTISRPFFPINKNNPILAPISLLSEAMKAQARVIDESRKRVGRLIHDG